MNLVERYLKQQRDKYKLGCVYQETFMVSERQYFRLGNFAVPESLSVFVGGLLLSVQEYSYDRLTATIRLNKPVNSWDTVHVRYLKQEEFFHRKEEM